MVSTLAPAASAGVRPQPTGFGLLNHRITLEIQNHLIVSKNIFDSLLRINRLLLRINGVLLRISGKLF
jgi:hypothetical protein